MILCVAYSLNRPSMLMGKTKNGQINLILLFINLPWLLLTWAIWLLEVTVSKEDKMNRIGQTNIYLGRYPLFTKIDSFDLIIDLTSEFPPCKARAKKYICLPNLDGVKLRNTTGLPSLSIKQKILIHCAQGHGRSATYASLLICQLFPTMSSQEALSLILKNRPEAIPSKSQLSQIQS